MQGQLRRRRIPVIRHLHGLRPGFALVVTISLMVLVSIIAVGLLSLAAISLRSAAGNEAMVQARSQARLALLLALGDLQATAGTDRAVTAGRISKKCKKRWTTDFSKVKSGHATAHCSSRT